MHCDWCDELTRRLAQQRALLRELETVVRFYEPDHPTLRKIGELRHDYRNLRPGRERDAAAHGQ